MRVALYVFGISVIDLTIGPNYQPDDDPGEATTTAMGFGFYPECRYDAVPGGET